MLPAWAAFALIDSNDGRYVHWLRSRLIPYASLLCPQRPTRCSLKLEFRTRYPGAYHVFTVDAQLSCSLTSSTRHSASSRQGQAQQGGESYRKAVILFESTNSCPSESQTPCAHASKATTTLLPDEGAVARTSLSVPASNLAFQSRYHRTTFNACQGDDAK